MKSIDKQKQPPKVLPELKVTLTRCKPNESFNYPEGQRTWLGGYPEWQQGTETPRCESCEKRMTFVGQIDSVEHEYANNPLAKKAGVDQDYMFGDVGTIYVFFCFECLEAASVCQWG